MSVKSQINIKIKRDAMKKYALHENDTGSTYVQVAILAEEIKYLQDHITLHPKDVSARRTLVKKTSKRKKYIKQIVQIHKKNEGLHI